jgi:hypothetical protein
MTMRWLPSEHDGPRTPAEAMNDLRIIAASGQLSEAHVVLDQPTGESVGGSGRLVLRERPDTAAVVLEVAGTEIAEIAPDTIESSHLRTYDGADYYVLVIDTVDGRLNLSDAYND